MGAAQRAALLVAMACLGSTACGKAFTSGGTGGGGASAGTTTGVGASTAAGTPSGSPTGTDTGSVTGTATGSETGSETGTPTGTTQWQCPVDPCQLGGDGTQPCDSPCVTSVCSYDPSCCTSAWSAKCVRLAVRSCGPDLCGASACNLLFNATPGYDLCATGGTCRFMATGGGTCATICGNQGATCLAASIQDTCSTNGITVTCGQTPTTENPVRCTCVLGCPTELCPPGQTCTNGSCS